MAVTDRLLYAAQHGDLEAWRFALDERNPPLLWGGVNATNLYGWSSLHFAAENNDLNLLRLILQWGSSVMLRLNAKDANGMTALHRAAGLGHEAVVTNLVGHGANAFVINLYGMTPVHSAAINGHANTINLIFLHCVQSLNAYQQLSGRDAGGMTPLLLASEGQHTAAMRVLEQWQAAYGVFVLRTARLCKRSAIRRLPREHFRLIKSMLI